MEDCDQLPVSSHETAFHIVLALLVGGQVERKAQGKRGRGIRS